VIDTGFISESSKIISKLERLEDGKGIKYPKTTDKEWKAKIK